MFIFEWRARGISAPLLNLNFPRQVFVILFRTYLLQKFMILTNFWHFFSVPCEFLITGCCDANAFFGSDKRLRRCEGRGVKHIINVGTKWKIIRAIDEHRSICTRTKNKFKSGLLYYDGFWKKINFFLNFGVGESCSLSALYKHAPGSSLRWVYRTQKSLLKTEYFSAVPPPPPNYFEPLKIRNQNLRLFTE